MKTNPPFYSFLKAFIFVFGIILSAFYFAPYSAEGELYKDQEEDVAANEPGESKEDVAQVAE